jgi:hypothetical protein
MVVNDRVHLIVGVLDELSLNLVMINIDTGTRVSSVLIFNRTGRTFMAFHCWLHIDVESEEVAVGFVLESKSPLALFGD